MIPFSSHRYHDFFAETYPPALKLAAVASSFNQLERELFVRLWMTEGIPFAFKECPFVFENVRTWLGDNIGINPKEITIAGSGRIGYSLSGWPKYGRLFGDKSDLDLMAVSKKLYSELVEEFIFWKQEYESGMTVPGNEREARLWADNLIKVPKIIDRGFIDNWKLPNLYPVTKNIANTLWLLIEKLKITEGAPTIKHSSIRVYRDWNAALRQMTLNFMTAIRSIDN